MSACLLLGGCATFTPSDGRDGQDVNIYDIYAAVNTERQNRGLATLDFLDFVKEYLSGVQSEYSEEEAAKAFINRSLMSSVALLTSFEYKPSRFSPAQNIYFSGSGVIVQTDNSTGTAYIVTNNHVVCCDITNGEVDGVRNDYIANPVFAGEVFVYLYGNDEIVSQSEITAQIICSSETYDIALLRVTNPAFKSSEITAAAFADGEEVYAGEKVYAVGNPDGAGISATTGIISRESETIQILSEAEEGVYDEYRVMRTDTAINGGNSGGGLFDCSGRLLGIINSKMDVEGEYIDGIGYALCGSYVKRLYKLMLEGGGSNVKGVTRAVFPCKYDYKSSSYFDNEKNVARIVDEVTVTSARGGLEVGDKIKKVQILNAAGEQVDFVNVTRYFNIDDVLLSARNGYSVVYTVQRGQEEVQITASPVFEYCV